MIRVGNYSHPIAGERDIFYASHVIGEGERPACGEAEAYLITSTPIVAVGFVVFCRRCLQILTERP